MSSTNRVVWTEGLFLRPQHLQQQDRYVERSIEARCRGLRPYAWGFTDIEFDNAVLTEGKVALERAAGVLPDGTTFQLPTDGPLPIPIQVGGHVRGEIVYFGIPSRQFDGHTVRQGTDDGKDDAGRDAHSDDALTRHRKISVEVKDSSSDRLARIEVAELRTRLLLSSDNRGAYSCLPLAFIVERRSDGTVVLDANFIPTTLHLGVAKPLTSFVREVHGRLRQRSRQLSGGASPKSGGVDFQFLQTVNRYEPLFEHYARTATLHPEELYRTCLSAGGELATFRRGKQRREFPAYDHEALRASFEPVMDEIRELVDIPIDQKSVRVLLTNERAGTWVGDIQDSTLLDQADFFLAARACHPSDNTEEQVQRKLASLTKVTSIPDFDALQEGAVLGVPLRFVTPGQQPVELPVERSTVCFRLVQEGKFWIGI